VKAIAEEGFVPQASTSVSSTAKSKYRPEIDGLRAFAVVAVIINHFNKALLPSGYLGVDIFFVISGYVITSSLANRESKNFVDFITGFYERRIKRLLPALVVFVLITSTLICLFNPDPGKALRTGITSLFGLSNLYLFKQSTDYFAQSTELNPFTHTWSLGVEEQFYLLFPFLIWFSGFGKKEKNGSKYLFLWIGVLTVASLAGFIYFYQYNQPAAYFLMPPRFWEMAAGCLVFIGFQKRAKFEKALEQVPPLLVVVVMIVIMFLPIAAAVPATISIVVLSSVLISCLKSETAAFAALTNAKVVYIGRASYSLYLWHWGILSITRWTIGISWWSAPLVLVIIFICSIISYECLEIPFRKIKFRHRRNAFAFGASILMSAAAIMGFLGIPVVGSKLTINRQNKGNFQRGRQSQSNYIGSITKRRNSDCGAAAQNLTESQIRSSMVKCLWKGPKADVNIPVVAILGDSHAHQLFPIAEEIAREFGVSVYNYQYWGCLVPQDARNVRDSKCLNVNNVPMWVYRELHRPMIFVIASIADPFLHFPSEDEQKKRVQAFKDAFGAVLDKGNYLIVVAPNPKFLDIDNAISDTCGTQVWSSLNPSCNTPHKFFAQSQKSKRKVYVQELRKWALDDKRVMMVDPFQVLCGEREGYCYSMSNHEEKYWDPSHLNLNAVLSTYPLYRSAIKKILHDHADLP